MERILTPEAVASLLAWYRENCRDLPWRRTRDPYCIWISEIMLQQTRVEAVKPYYERFLEVCPTVRELAELPEDQLMKLWEGLGYYSRARNLQRAAKQILSVHEGRLPASYESLLSLCGIGEYTAGAIASIAFDLPIPAIDGNVLRVLSRLSGSYMDITLPATKAAWRARLSKVIPRDAGDFTQALIELGATVCVPNGEAKCQRCPLASVCVAAREHLCDELPVRSSKRPRRIVPMTVLLIRDGDRTVLHKRPPKGLLAGLFELPNTEYHMDEVQTLAHVRALGLEPVQITPIEDAKHIFTHIEWHMKAYDVRISPDFDGFDTETGLLLVKNSDLHEHYAIPSAFAAYKKYL